MEVQKVYLSGFQQETGHTQGRSLIQTDLFTKEWSGVKEAKQGSEAPKDWQVEGLVAYSRLKGHEKRHFL